MESALRRAVKGNKLTRDWKIHIIITGNLGVPYPILREWMVINNSKPLMLTHLFMYRDLLISKEQMKRLSSGKSYRQYDHRTPIGGETYKESVGDDLESFFNDQKVRRSPLIGYTEETWTYFIRELTEEELHLVQKKDRGFFEKFRWSTDPDIDETEMSTSTSKYISAYCNRHTEYFVNYSNRYESYI